MYIYIYTVLQTILLTIIPTNNYFKVPVITAAAVYRFGYFNHKRSNGNKIEGYYYKLS
jgi:hypothetical protein